MERIISMLRELTRSIYFPQFRVNSAVEIIIIAIILYQVLKWVKDTRAWTLFKGIIVVFAFALFAYIFQLTAILWIFTNTFSVIIISIFVLFQPELRRALEQLGRKNFVTSLFASGNEDTKNKKDFDRRNNEIVKAVDDLAKEKTGALIVIEKDVLLNEYERTGIPVDGLISSQLLVNLFEHNTPMHDGAVFIRGNRIVAATCYLPLSDNMELSKALGTRHRAALGISEVSDSLTIVVSEETGNVSVAQDGKLAKMYDMDQLKALLGKLQKTKGNEKKVRKVKGIKNVKKTNK